MKITNKDWKLQEEGFLKTHKFNYKTFKYNFDPYDVDFLLVRYAIQTGTLRELYDVIYGRRTH